MVRLLLLLCVVAGAKSEELITLSDGRTLLGIYDAEAGVVVVTEGKIVARVAVKPSAIVSRKTIGDPPPDPKVIEAAAERERLRVLDEQRAAESKRRQIATEEDAARRARATEARDRAEYWRKQGLSVDPMGKTAAEIDQEIAAQQEHTKQRLKREADEAAARERADAEAAQLKRDIAEDRAYLAKRQAEVDAKEKAQREQDEAAAREKIERFFLSSLLTKGEQAVIIAIDPGDVAGVRRFNGMLQEKNSMSLKAFKVGKPDPLPFYVYAELNDLPIIEADDWWLQTQLPLTCHDPNGVSSITVVVSRNTTVGKFVFDSLKDGKLHLLLIGLRHSTPYGVPEIFLVHSDPLAK